jgi:hypothetical protein
MNLIICTGGNHDFTKIAESHGFLYGIQFPDIARKQVFFADQNWKNPKRREYMDALRLYRPKIATVLDLERQNQFGEVMEWAHQASQFVEEDIVIIPKVNGIITKLPQAINNKRVVLGYSVPSMYGTTNVPDNEFYGWPLHFLGGEPYRQCFYVKRFYKHCQIVSIDCNFHQKMATRFCQFFTEYPICTAKNHCWPTLKEARIKTIDGPKKAFDLSCAALKIFWSRNDF